MTEQEFTSQITNIFNSALAAIKRNFNINLKIKINALDKSKNPRTNEYNGRVSFSLIFPNGKIKPLSTGWSIYNPNVLAIPEEGCKEYGFDCKDKKVTCLPFLAQNILRMSSWFYCHYLEYNTEF